MTQQPTERYLLRNVRQYLAAFLRAVTPVPDIVSRQRVRRTARNLVRLRDPWPDMNATGADAARLALLRLLRLQRETHQAVRHRQSEAATMLARASIDTLITGLYCCYEPGAAALLHKETVRQLPLMLQFVADAGLIPSAVLAQCIAGLGLGAVNKKDRPPTIEVMASEADKAMGGSVATEIYRKFYRPTSNFSVHSGAASLLRHVQADGRLTRRPWRIWLRRAPVRIADTCVGALTAVVAKEAGKPFSRAARYADKHGERVVPPITVIGVGSGLGRLLGPRTVLTTVSLIREGYRLARAGDGGDPVAHSARIRSVMERVLAPAVPPSMPKAAVDPFLDFIADEIAVG